MIKIIITEDSDNGKSTKPGKLAIDDSEDVRPIEIEAILKKITGAPFQESVKSMLRQICKKHHIPVSEIDGF